MAMMGMGGAVGLAGCIGDDDDEGSGDTPTPGTTPTDTNGGEDQTIVEGGTLEVAIAENVQSFDPAYSSDTTSSLAQSFMFEGLTTSDREGNQYNWLAADSWHDAEEDVNDVSEEDYVPYMTEVGTTTTDTGVTVPDTDSQVIMTAPDDPGMALLPDHAEEVGDGEGAVAAIEDGTFGMAFHYELHEGIEFSDGTPLTADIVVDTYQRYENSDLAAQTFNQLLAGIAHDDQELTLYAQFPDAEAWRSLPVSVHHPDQIGLPGGELDPREGNPPIGTGPYVYEEFQGDRYYIVTKNEDYWLQDVTLEEMDWWDGSEQYDEYPVDGPVVDEIDMDIMPSNASRLGALEAGDIDFTYGLSTGALDDLVSSDEFEVKDIETGGYDFMQYPVNVEPWDDVRLRQAVNHLILRESIVDQIFNGWVRATWTPLPQIAWGLGTEDYDALEEDLRPSNEYDPEAARSLLEELESDGVIEPPIEVQIEVNADNTDRVDMATLIADEMEILDEGQWFSTNVEQYEWLTYTGRVLSPTYGDRGHLMIIGLSGTFNPDSFCAALHHSRNIGACCNSQGIDWTGGDDAPEWDGEPVDLDTMIDDALFGVDALDDDFRREQYDEIWHALTELVPTSYLNIGSTIGVHNQAVQGFEPYPFPESLLIWGLYAPQEDVITWIDR